jgi:hypothetical protein
MFTKYEDFVQMTYGTEGIRKIPTGANPCIFSKFMVAGDFSNEPNEQRAQGMRSAFIHTL